MNGENVRFFFYAIYLVIIPILFYFAYEWYALREERKAVEARTAVMPKVVEALRCQINAFKPRCAENTEITIEQVKFLHYGLVKRGEGRYSVDEAKYGCLFKSKFDGSGGKVL